MKTGLKDSESAYSLVGLKLFTVPGFQNTGSQLENDPSWEKMGWSQVQILGNLPLVNQLVLWQITSEKPQWINPNFMHTEPSTSFLSLMMKS